MAPAATTEPKPKAKKTKAKPADPPVDETGDPVGSPLSTNSREKRAYELSKAMESCYFTASVGELMELDEADFNAMDTLVCRIQADAHTLAKGEAIPEADRTLPPDHLLAYHAATAEQCDAARKDGAAAKLAGRTTDHNPYPPGTALSVYWRDAFNGDVAEGADTKLAVAETKGSPPDLNNAANAAEIAAKKDVDAKADRLRQQQLAIEAAQHEMEEAVTHQEELAEQIIDSKADLKELKASYDAAVTRGQKAAKALRRARAGIFDRTLPFPKAERDTTLDVPDQNIGGDGAKPAEPAKPPEPARDEGAFVSLDHLVKTDLQEFIPGTAEDVGISQKQSDLLKDKVGGTGSVGDLEKFMRDNGEWWHKEIEGVGKETRGKIEDALAVVRRKFPMPDPTEAIMEAAAVALNNGQMPGAEVVVNGKGMTSGQAISRLNNLIERADEIADEIEGPNAESGREFLSDVASKAAEVRDTVVNSGKVTDKQREAILGWEAGVEGWARSYLAPDGIGGADEDENDDFGEELDVPDEDGDDE